ncbi:16261_t:CDS:2 [Funneliformis mosseae]|uniref:16261_t:CDS:1 n=1 Tax=Funneliformis mosseae TaxID=27381 RepID=A0A9N9CGL0_FUNMO|nr:16261_t:CDS:2 [Funneliformis mosseae]
MSQLGSVPVGFRLLVRTIPLEKYHRRLGQHLQEQQLSIFRTATTNDSALQQRPNGHAKTLYFISDGQLLRGGTE